MFYGRATVSCSASGRKVVIIGGGFGGLTAAKRLGKSGSEIVLIDKTNHHLFQPLLYQVATAALSAAEIAMPIRSVLRKQKNITIMLEEVEGIDTQDRKVRLSDNRAVGYDHLVVAVGGGNFYFGHDDWAQHAPGLKTIDDAVYIRDRILLAFEQAEAGPCNGQPNRFLNFVIIGGGPTGVELSGAIAETSRVTMLRDFRNIDPAMTRVFLVEARERILPEFPRKLSDHAREDLMRLGVEVITGSTVLRVDEYGVQTGDRFIDAATVLWAAGIRASPLLETLGVELDRMGRVVVGPDLSIPGHPEVFVIGDAASVRGGDGEPLQGLAPVAIQEGAYVADIIKKGVGKEMRKPFVYKDKGILATIGKNHAVCKTGRLEFNGFPAWLFWSVLHLRYIIVFANRLVVMLRWTLGYITGQRGARLIFSKPGK